MSESRPPTLDYGTPQTSGRRKEMLLVVVPLISYVSAFVFVVPWVSAVTLVDNDRKFAAAVASLTAFFARRFVYRLLLEGRQDDKAESERWFAYATCLFAVVMFFASIRFDNCTHGSITAFGPVAIANSNVGGPCRNHIGWRKRINIGGDWYVCF